MLTIDQLLDRAKELHGIETDSGLAKALGVGRAAVSGWRHGQRLPDPVVCATLAGLTGEPLAKVLGVIGEARAVSREEKAVWRKLAATAMTLALGVSFALPARAQDAVTGFEASHSIHYAKLVVLLVALAAVITLAVHRAKCQFL